MEFLIKIIKYNDNLRCHQFELDKKLMYDKTLFDLFFFLVLFVFAKSHKNKVYMYKD